MVLSVTSLNCSNHGLSIDSLPTILALEEEKRKQTKRSSTMVEEEKETPTREKERRNARTINQKAKANKKRSKKGE